jgi:hypothetical protein
VPCFSLAHLRRKLELYGEPGIYIRENGTKEYYEPIVNEKAMRKEILDMIHQNV